MCSKNAALVSEQKSVLPDFVSSAGSPAAVRARRPPRRTNFDLKFNQVISLRDFNYGIFAGNVAEPPSRLLVYFTLWLSLLASCTLFSLFKRNVVVPAPRARRCCLRLSFFRARGSPLFRSALRPSGVELVPSSFGRLCLRASESLAHAAPIDEHANIRFNLVTSPSPDRDAPERQSNSTVASSWIIRWHLTHAMPSNPAIGRSLQSRGAPEACDLKSGRRNLVKRYF